jgi:hypothetical protein
MARVIHRKKWGMEQGEGRLVAVMVERSKGRAMAGSYCADALYGGRRGGSQSGTGEHTQKKFAENLVVS